MKKTGPDSLEGVFIAAVCCLISTLMFGSAGLASMLFVACIERYNADRNNAAFPFILSSVLQAVTGPFAGYFAKRFGLRAVVLSGSVLGFVGIGTCFFAEDITVITVMWGIVFGTGFGLSTLLLPAIINDYFVKKRSIALGTSYLGSPIGFFVYPPIFEVLLEKYGLSGTFLFLAGINMNCVPLSLLLRRPTFKTEEEKAPLNDKEKRESYSSTDSRTPDLEAEISENHLETKGGSCFRRNSVEILYDQNHSSDTQKEDNKQFSLVLNKKVNATHSNAEISQFYRTGNTNGDENVHKDLVRASSDTIIHHENGQIKENGQYSISDDLKLIKGNNSGNLEHHPKPQNHEELSTIYYSSSKTSSTPIIRECGTNNLPRHLDSRDLMKSEGNLYCYYNEAYLESKQPSITLSEAPTLLKYRKIDGFSNYPAEKRTDEEKYEIKPPEKAEETSSLLHMYLNPVFIMICLNNGIASLVFATLTTVIIDFSRDLEIDLSNEKFIMMNISLLGAVGMLGFGWVTDGDFMSRTNFGCLTQFIGCACTVVLPFTVGFTTLMIPLSVWCVCQASFIPLIPAIIAENFAEDIQTVAVSACNVLSGPMYLVIPPLIGFFRDNKGSYDNIFYLMGALSFLNGIIVFIIPYLSRWKSKSSQKS